MTFKRLKTLSLSAPLSTAQLILSIKLLALRLFGNGTVKNKATVHSGPEPEHWSYHFEAEPPPLKLISTPVHQALPPVLLIPWAIHSCHGARASWSKSAVLQTRNVPRQASPSQQRHQPTSSSSPSWSCSYSSPTSSSSPREAAAERNRRVCYIHTTVTLHLCSQQ